MFGARAVPVDATLQIAFSGGMDSHVLLHALAGVRNDFPFTLGAIHIDHGLQSASAEWADHCDRICSALGVPLEVRRVEVTGLADDGLEAAARRARYAALAESLAPTDYLLTAQHRDDQAETLLLQLLRGAGVAGLAAMPFRTALGQGTHLRPLLEFDRAALAIYAREKGLVWIDDPSNRDLQRRRNYLRHEILPRLQGVWPDAVNRLAYSAAHMAEASTLLNSLASNDLAHCQLPDRQHAEALSARALAGLPDARQRNALRHWLRNQGVLPPGIQQLDAIQAQIQAKPRSSHACVSWGNVEIWRYRDQLVAIPRLPSPTDSLDATWDLVSPLFLPGIGCLRAEAVHGQGLDRKRLPPSLHVRTRHGGEVIRLIGRRHHHAIKKLLQSAGVPPWRRKRLPMLYAGEELVAVADLWVAADFAAGRDAPGTGIVWEPFAPGLTP